MLNFKHYRQWSVVNFLLSEVVLVALLHILFRLCKIITGGKLKAVTATSGWLKRNHVLAISDWLFLHLMFEAVLLTRDLTRTGSITNGVKNIEIYGKNPSL